MSFAVEYHPLAAAELVDAQAWYEKQTVGLGDRFLTSFETTMKRVSSWPNTGTPVEVDDSGAVADR